MSFEQSKRPVREFRNIAGSSLLFFLIEILVRPPALFHPSFGVAIALLLLGSRRMATISILLGSIAAGLFLEFSFFQILCQSVVQLTQALVAVELAKKLLGSQHIDDLSKLKRLCLTICPIAALLGTALTLGTSLAGNFFLLDPPRRFFLLHWFSLTLGAAIFTPLCLCLFHPERPWTNRRLTAAVPTLACLFIIFFGRSLVQKNHEQTVRANLDRQINETTSRVQDSLDSFSQQLQSLASLYEASNQISEGEFRGFIEQVAQHHSEALVLAWMPEDGSLGEAKFYFSPNSTSQSMLQTIDWISILEQARRSQSKVLSLAHTESNLTVTVIAIGPPAKASHRGFVAGAFSPQTSLDSVDLGDLAPDRYSLILRTGSKEESGEVQAQTAALTIEPRFEIVKSCHLAGSEWVLEFAGTPSLGARPRATLPLLLAVTGLLQYLFIVSSTHRVYIEELNQELEVATERARAADHAKGAFLANMSHEIRTPMNGILGLTRLLLGSELQSAQAQQLEHVVHSAEALLALLNDILDFSKIEANELQVTPIPQSLSTLLEQSVRIFSLSAEEKGVELLVAVSPEVSDDIIVDGHRLRQVLLNLIGNAIKFTDAGEVKISVTPREISEEGAQLVFSVSDTGVGIGAKHQDRIFQAFSQVESVEGIHYAGTGLGLAVSSRLVELMGGNLSVQSQSGQGSTFTFTFTLPCSLGPSEILDFGPDIDLKDTPTYLDIEHPGRASILKTILRGWGFPVVQDKQEAKLFIAEETHLTARAQSDTATIIILSSSRVLSLFEHCQRSGATALLRPVTPKNLQEAIRSTLSPNAPSTTKTASKIQDLYAGCRALVVDDNATNRLLANLLLEKMGFQVDLAEDGMEAIKRTKASNFDLILMDIRMPGIDGYETLKRLRDQGQAVPIIAVTAHQSDSHRQGAQESGFSGFLSKPLDQEALWDLIRSLVPRPRQIVCLQTLLESVGGDKASALAVRDSFLAEVPELMEPLNRPDDLQAISSACHNLRGLVETFGAKELGRALQDLESLPPEPSLEKQQALNLVLEECEQVQAILSTLILS